MSNRVVSTNSFDHDDDEINLRPLFLNEYIGQDSLKEKLRIYIKAAKMRNETIDHILLYGPPGLGKTTLAQIVANEMNTNIRITTGSSIEKSGDLAAILSSLQPGDILFIDEIHRLPHFISEMLYSAMEDYVLDVIVGKDNNIKSIRIDLPPFTLIGATTRFGEIASPLRDRFGVVERLDYYTDDDLVLIIERTSCVYNISITKEAAKELAIRSRGTPRIANRLFRRIRDYALVLGDGNIDINICRQALLNIKVDKTGLDELDTKYLNAIIKYYNGGPVGISSLASTINEETSTLEDICEPFLIKEGFVKRTPRGRIATDKAYKHLNYKK